MAYEIRRLQPGDWEVLRDVRLTALAEAPHAFFGRLDEEAGYDEQRWRTWIAGSAIFVAWDGPRPAGVAGGYAHPHGGWHLVSMWVSPHARGTGLAGRLVDTVTRHARAQDAPTLTLWVTDGNNRARAFYQRMGFRGTGRRQPVRPEEPQRWEEEMLLSLRD